VKVNIQVIIKTIQIEITNDEFGLLQLNDADDSRLTDANLSRDCLGL
jgi:hypothetical protein